jgi:hypothetical protein
MMKAATNHHNANHHAYYPPRTDFATLERCPQRWNVVQYELIPELARDFGPLTPKLKQVVHTLEWVRAEEYCVGGCGVGRPPHERDWIANAFVAKGVLEIATTVGLIDRLMIEPVLRRICGFHLHKKLPSASTFSRAFDEFAQSALPERAHEALIKEHLGEELIGHLSRDSTAIEARERAQRPVDALKSWYAQQPDLFVKQVYKQTELDI